jgi:hypothetical protein
MARPVYSTEFFAIAGLSGTHTYIVPAGFIAILRDVDAYANVTVASRELHLIGDHGQTIWWQSWGTEDQFAAQWHGRQVIEPGGIIRAVTSDLIDVSASGYLLSLP